MLSQYLIYNKPPVLFLPTPIYINNICIIAAINNVILNNVLRFFKLPGIKSIINMILNNLLTEVPVQPDLTRLPKKLEASYQVNSAYIFCSYQIL